MPPLPLTVLTCAVACVPPVGGADRVTADDVVYPDPAAVTSIPLLALPP